MLNLSLVVPPSVLFPSSQSFVNVHTQKLVIPKLQNNNHRLIKISNNILKQSTTAAATTASADNIAITSAATTTTTGVSSHSGSSTSTCLESSLLWSPSQQKDCQYLKEGLKKDLIPRHIAVIFDGNRRWLKAQGKPLDYVPFFQINGLFANLCLKWGVAAATTFIYSYDNLQRGKEATELIFGQLERFLEHNLEDFIRKKIKVVVIGERKEYTKSLQDIIKQVEEATKNEAKPKLEWRLAICYAGTRDILQATRKLCEKAKAGVIEPSAIDMTTFDGELEAGTVPTPELLIRTGGELRLSNYLVWHLALAEYYFLPIQAPEFTEGHFIDALRSFQQRDRNFGK